MRPGTLAVVHGASELGLVTVDTYNAELRDPQGFIGDRASNRAFRAILEESRERLRDVAKDPLGDTATADLSKRKLDKVLVEGEPEAAGVIHGAIEEFSAELTTVVRRFLKLKEWQKTQRIVVGGGLRASRVGEIVIGRASVLLKGAGHAIDLVPIHHHPDEAGLLGAVYLAPAWVLAGHDAILAIDIGGSNLRTGVVGFQLNKASQISGCTVKKMELWRYAEAARKPTRDQAVARIGRMLVGLRRWGEKEKLKLAPFIGVACPGVIAEDGRIERGGQNLPGNWESKAFNLAQRLAEKIPRIGDHDATVVVHNDAVVQGLSEIPYLEEVDRWGVLTIGTGLGNARFTNQRRERRRKADKP